MTWYKDGLRFKCTECGKCCTGAPGCVFLTADESKSIANFLGCSLEVFLANFTRRINGRLALTEKPRSYDCIFLRDNKCQIYPFRPEQCRTFPWWKENLTSKKAWLEAKADCEGIDHPEGELISCEQINDRCSS